MAGTFNPLDHPACLSIPERLAPSHWVEHLPFAMWVVSALRPRLLVELGAFRGTSYCGFCQCIKSLGLSTRAFAVDTWKGDPHNGINGPEILSDLRAHHDPRYGGFSTLLEMNFDEAAPQFAPGEIDLLHIDGYHTYEAVRHDYETWRPRLSERGVILFHDIVERIQDFGVWRFWEEIRTEYPSFEFHHEHGLGVLAVGPEVPESIRSLVETGPEGAVLIRTLFHQLGRRIKLSKAWDEETAEAESWHHASLPLCTRGDCEELRLGLEARIRRLSRRAAAAESHRDLLAAELAQEKSLRESVQAENQSLRHDIVRFEHDWAGLEHSLSWRLTRTLAGAGKRLAPPGTGRRHALKAGARLVQIGYREGVSSMPGRLLARANHYFEGKFAPDVSDRMPWVADARPVFLQVHHGGGGGIERHLYDLCSWLRTSGVRTVLVAPGPRGSLRWEEPGPDGVAIWQSHTVTSRESIDVMLADLKPAHAHVHSMIGITPLLLEEFTGRRLPFDWTIHDYSSICPRVHLDRDDGRYCGEPDTTGCKACLDRLGDHRGRLPDESIEIWRQRHEVCLRQARRILAPSHDTKKRLERYFPGLNIVVRPHLETPAAVRNVAAAYRHGARLRVAVIGTITTLKGSHLLQLCAEDAAQNDRPIEFVVVGRTDRDAALARSGRVTLTGPFRENEILDRLESAGCHLALLPSVVPETYMYTLSTAIRAGLFPVCLDLGAQSERLRERGWGLIVRADASAAEINQAMLEAAGTLGAQPVSEPQGTAEPLGDPLESYYGFTDEERRHFGLPAEGEDPVAPQHHFVGRDAHARFH